MRRLLGPLLVLLVCAAGIHALALHFAPAFIMNRAMAALEQRGVALHAFTTPLRVTPQTQQVVRSSPDLYYALCRYDLGAEGGADLAAAPRVTVRMAAWDDYQSLSFFDARTNNFATIRGAGKAVTVILRKAGDGSADGGGLTVYSPTDTGVILIRRLAPTAQAFAAAAALAEGDECAFRPEPASAP